MQGGHWLLPYDFRGKPWSPIPHARCSTMTNCNFCAPFIPPAHTGWEGHIRLTYFGQWSEVEPQCCREASDNLYCAPGKKGGVPGPQTLGAFVWIELRTTKGMGHVRVG